VSQQRPFVVFDLDEVLCDLRHGTHEALTGLVPNYPHWTKWLNYFHFEQQGISLDRFLELLVDHQILENAQPAAFAGEVLDVMHELGFRTAVVTARGYHPNGERLTREWFEKHRLAVDELRLVHMLESKADAIRGLGKVVAYIDDLPAHLNRLAEAQVGGQLYLMRAPWNSHSFAYRTVRSLSEFAREIATQFGALKNKNNKEQANVGGIGGQGPGR
jgi:hypothetical protein